MQLYYGDNNPLRLLDETEFWKTQEGEHTVVIKEIVPNLEINFVSKLDDFKLLFDQTQAQAVQMTETYVRSKGMFNQEFFTQIMNFIYYCMNQSQRFVDFLNELKGNSDAIKANIIAQTVINHIIRESKYYIGIAQIILYR